MLERWYWLSIVVIFLWALGGFFGKVALKYHTPYRVYFFEAVGTLTVATVVLLLRWDEIFQDFSISIPALLMGLMWGVGTVLFIVALKYGKLSIIAPLTSTYPVITVILAIVFLKESLSLRESLGVFFAVLAAALLAE